MPFYYIIDSTENLFNDISAMVPSTIRDVAWYLNLGKGTGKVVFDEWLNPACWFCPNGYLPSCTSIPVYQLPNAHWSGCVIATVFSVVPGGRILVPDKTILSHGDY